MRSPYTRYVRPCIAAVTWCVLSVLACDVNNASAADGPPTRDVVFAKVDDHQLKLNLFLPKDTENPPLVVFIHGGGWRNGSYQRCHVPWLAEHGFAVASVGYRLTDKAIFPAQVHDCKAAIRWLRAHAPDYGYDASRIVVVGTSAGGHLALMLGVTSGDKSFEGKVGEHVDQSTPVHAVVDFYGPSDFILRSKQQPHKTETPGSPVHRLLGGPVSEKPDLARRASPAFHVGKTSPPLLIIHGDKDQTVPFSQSQRMVDAYRKHDRPVTLHTIKGGGHGGKAYFQGETRKRLIAFLREHLRPTKKAEAKD